MKKMGIMSLSVLTALLLTACSSDDNKDSVSKITGKFIDSAVSGLTYQCSSGASGTTNTEGEFTCNVGDTVVFSLNGLEVGSAKADSVITPKTLYPGNEDASVNVAQLLQTLDSDNDPSNGITIDSDTNAYAALKDLNIDFDSSNFDNLIEEKLGENLVNESSAKEHLEKSLSSLAGADVDISSYSAIAIYKNVSSRIVDVIAENHSDEVGIKIVNINSTKSCKDYGYNSSHLLKKQEHDGVTTESYLKDHSSTCAEIDYSNAKYGKGTSNLALVYKQ